MLQTIIIHAIAGKEELNFQFVASDLYARLKTLMNTTTEETNIRQGYSITAWYVDGQHGTKEALGIFVYTPGGKQIKFFAYDITIDDVNVAKSVDLTRVTKVRQQL